jgi:hypothetical protein
MPFIRVSYTPSDDVMIYTTAAKGSREGAGIFPRGVSSLTSSLPIGPPAPRMVNMISLLARLILVRL